MCGEPLCENREWCCISGWRRFFDLFCFPICEGRTGFRAWLTSSRAVLHQGMGELEGMDDKICGAECAHVGRVQPAQPGDLGRGHKKEQSR